MDHSSVWVMPFPFHYHSSRFRCSRVYLPGDENVPQLMRYLILKPITRFTPAVNYSRSDRSKTSLKPVKRFCSSGNASCAVEISMAGEAEKNERHQPGVSGESSTLDGKKEGEKKPEKSTAKNIPPPPEKPLPDDCCGSGCVRCVWDIYYDELEEYNKLYRNKQSDKNV